MEEYNRIDLQRNLGKQSSRSFSALSGRSTPRGSPSNRRVRRDDRSGAFSVKCFRSNRIVLWLLLITLWAYAGFYVQSRWAHGDNKKGIFGGSDESSESEQISRMALSASNDSLIVKIGAKVNQSGVKEIDGKLRRSVAFKKHRKRSRGNNKSSRINHGNNRKDALESEDSNNVEEIPKTNATYGMLVGPFGSVEDRVLEWSPDKRSGTCDRKGQFYRLVWSRKFVLIFHELSMTEAPLSMMELASELLSCGATVSVVVLSRNGGLMPELARRKINVVEDRDKVSFKTAMKADLVIAGSAGCASWVEQYLEHSVAGTRQLVWWIMENQQEYFNRSKLVINRVKKLVFLSETQCQQWLSWCKEENIQLKTPPSLVPLSVNDELAFVAGISSSLNTPSFTTAKMLQKRQLLRKSVREEMRLKDDDMLVMSLSSINPEKGHVLLLESALLTTENGGVKILIGSVGSKSNEVPYVKDVLGYLSKHSNLSKSVLWTPATMRVASLYAAADVCVINSQELGETFGRVTIEAMAFGLPVLGTDAGGTKEIVEHNVTGLLHPVGHPGIHNLSKNLRYLIENPLERRRMGLQGREKVKRMYLKKHMYNIFWEVLYNTMRVK